MTPEKKSRAPAPGGRASAKDVPPDEMQIRTPSQAEGERELIEHDLREHEAGRPRRQRGARHRVATESGTQSGEDVVRTPSQAEGDRDQIERDLAEKQGDRKPQSTSKRR